MTEQTLIEGVEPAPERTLVERLRASIEWLERDGFGTSATLARESIREIQGLREYMAELEAAVRHEADCAEAYKAEAAALRAEVEALRAQQPVAEALCQLVAEYGRRADDVGRSRGSNCYALNTKAVADTVEMGARLCAGIRALAAAPAQPVAVPQGWRLVPADATPEMQTAGVVALREASAGYLDPTHMEAREAYCDMLAAAPAAPVRQPLTDDQLDELAMDEDGLPNSHLEFARAIERAHGIGVKA